MPESSMVGNQAAIRISSLRTESSVRSDCRRIIGKNG